MKAELLQRQIPSLGDTLGVMELKKQNGMYMIKRDLIPGKNVPE
ncbi:hypothetical protein [Salinimicrobium sp. TH3]|nr:hypothetical protein [Salinimicrobium sp. TH3]MCY2685754.1 hypothetical protein [Salinimicrobium sp. TH3]